MLTSKVFFSLLMVKKKKKIFHVIFLSSKQLSSRKRERFLQLKRVDQWLVFFFHCFLPYPPLQLISLGVGKRSICLGIYMIYHPAIKWKQGKFQVKKHTMHSSIVSHPTNPPIKPTSSILSLPNNHHNNL